LLSARNYPFFFEERLGDVADLEPDLMSFMVAGLGEFLRYFARFNWSVVTTSPLQRLRVNFDGLFESHFHGRFLSLNCHTNSASSYGRGAETPTWSGRERK